LENDYKKRHQFFGEISPLESISGCRTVEFNVMTSELFPKSDTNPKRVATKK
jgi:hypothetical protein